ncbi:ISAs1 family transposase [Actinacidiphila oryziradicis]|uniref:ISAs1 family transposase n=1 Tax=Actinacidiphila oryziradicis TaxID=2571141 RepID=UPI00145C4109
MPDRRAQRGLRHPLLVILVLAACATLVVGGDSVAAIWQWAARSPQDKLARIGARCDPLTGRFEVPSERTFRRVLADLDTDALDAATCGYAADVVRGTAPAPRGPARTLWPCGARGAARRSSRRAAQHAAEHPAPPSLLPAAAVDGKALRGARTEQGRVFLVGAIGHESGVLLGQRQVADKRGEGSAVRELLASLEVSGMVLTLDALHTTKKTARLITDELHARYVLILKGNQPLARAAAQALLASPDADWVQTTDIDEDRGHGRTERRTIRTAPADDTLFPQRGPGLPSAPRQRRP